MPDFFEVIKQRYSCREFTKTEVTQDDLEQIMEAGWRAPTAFTIQPWHFIAVRDEQTLNELGRVQPCVAQAGAAVVALGNPVMSDFWREDLSAAIENMHLAATARGYASLWVAVLDKQLVNPVLEIPPPWVPLAILAIGKAAQPGSQAPRKDPADVISWERFGQKHAR